MMMLRPFCQAYLLTCKGSNFKTGYLAGSLAFLLVTNISRVLIVSTGLDREKGGGGGGGGHPCLSENLKFVI